MWKQTEENSNKQKITPRQPFQHALPVPATPSHLLPRPPTSSNHHGTNPKTSALHPLCPLLSYSHSHKLHFTKYSGRSHLIDTRNVGEHSQEPSVSSTPLYWNPQARAPLSSEISTLSRLKFPPNHVGLDSSSLPTNLTLAKPTCSTLTCGRRHPSQTLDQKEEKRV